MPCIEIAYILKRRIHSIVDKIQALDLGTHINAWTEEEIELLKNEYAYNPKIFDKLPRHSPLSIVRKANDLRIKRECGNYDIDFCFFESWTHESAYLIGFMMADGYVDQKRSRFSIELSYKDYNFLLKIKKDLLKSRNPIQKKEHRCMYKGKLKTYKSCEITVHNKKMVCDLIEKGVLPNKTNRTSIPKDLPSEYIADFIRGYLDGDGSIYKSDGRIRFVGTHYFLKQLSDVIWKMYRVKHSRLVPHNKNDNCYGLDYATIASRKLAKALYKNAIFYMNRKFLNVKTHVKKDLEAAREETPGKINLTQIRQGRNKSSKPEGKAKEISNV